VGDQTRPEEIDAYVKSWNPAAALHPKFWRKDHWLVLGLMKQVAEAANRVAAGSVVLDFGCGAKPYEPLFANTTFIGIDVRPSRYADLVVTEGEKVQLPAGQADFILSTQVLHLTKDPCGYLAECRRLIKPTGTLFLTTHGMWTYHTASGGDYYRYTQGGLTHMMRTHGFEITDLKPIIGTLAAATHIRQLVLSSFLETRGLNFVSAVLNVLLNARIAIEESVSPIGMRMSSPAAFACTAKPVLHA
jgi:2-polyprenyl-3-methyl-5-hydroxy-6-metoxy-1,4-benzoquinol methylase